MIFSASMFPSSAETQVVKRTAVAAFVVIFEGGIVVVIAVNISRHISLPPQTDTNIIMPM